MSRIGRYLAALALLAVFAAAGCGDPVKREAVVFLDRAEQMDIDAPRDVRARIADGLEAMELSEGEVVEVRDACVEGHRALIDAEESQEEAGAALARLSDGDPEARLSADQAAEIEAQINHSSEAVALARERLEACDQGMSRLRSSYAGRH